MQHKVLSRDTYVHTHVLTAGQAESQEGQEQGVALLCSIELLVALLRGLVGGPALCPHSGLLLGSGRRQPEGSPHDQDHHSLSNRCH